MNAAAKLLNQAIADGAFEGGRVVECGELAYSLSTADNHVAIADECGWREIQSSDILAIADSIRTK